MKKSIKTIVAVLAVCAASLACAIPAPVAAKPAILETYTGEDTVSVYVKGAGREGISVQIATAEAEKVDAVTVSEMDIPMKTLVLIDNSKSIAKKDRGKISDLLQDIISGLENEEISIATFSKGTDTVADYSADYKTLKRAADGIKYQKQQTYLTDVLYDLIDKQYAGREADEYRRIIVISDGMDNKSLGYTREELADLLEDNPLPIYTIGCSTGDNDDQLENMFAISRQTHAEYFLLDEIDDMFDISDALDEDLEVLKLTITLPDQMLDGAKKAIKITLPDGGSLTADVPMPQRLQPAEPEKAEPEPEPQPAAPETEEESGDKGIPVIAIIIAIVACAAALLIVLVIRRKKKNADSFEAFDGGLPDEGADSPVGEKTVMLDAFQNDGKNHDGTVMIWNRDAEYQVVLTDVNSPAKSFRAPLAGAVVIGRSADRCDIAIDYDKSVSGRHCEISVNDGRFYVTDLQSSNGTFLNGSKVLAKTEIFPGNTLKLGRLLLRFEVR